jgi:Ras-related protein Rab-2A
METDYILNKLRYTFKFIVIGDSGIGKTSLVRKYQNIHYKHTDPDPTIGVEFTSVTFNSGNYIIKNQIWDTAGQEAYRSLTKSFFHGKVGFIVAFDITRRDSFNQLPMWLRYVNDYVSKNISENIVIVGCKSDLNKYRRVQYNEALKFAQKHKHKYIETSSKNFINVNKPFLYLSDIILKKVLAGKIIPDEYNGVMLYDSNIYEKKINKSCCIIL